MGKDRKGDLDGVLLSPRRMFSAPVAAGAGTSAKK
jgi:hypothetical protein